MSSVYCFSLYSLEESIREHVNISGDSIIKIQYIAGLTQVYQAQHVTEGRSG